MGVRGLLLVMGFTVMVSLAGAGGKSLDVSPSTDTKDGTSPAYETQETGWVTELAANKDSDAKKRARYTKYEDCSDLKDCVDKLLVVNKKKITRRREFSNNNSMAAGRYGTCFTDGNGLGDQEFVEWSIVQLKLSLKAIDYAVSEAGLAGSNGSGSSIINGLSRDMGALGGKLRAAEKNFNDSLENYNNIGDKFEKSTSKKADERNNDKANKARGELVRSEGEVGGLVNRAIELLTKSKGSLSKNKGVGQLNSFIINGLLGNDIEGNIKDTDYYSEFLMKDGKFIPQSRLDVSNATVANATVANATAANTTAANTTAANITVANITVANTTVSTTNITASNITNTSSVAAPLKDTGVYNNLKNGSDIESSGKGSKPVAPSNPKTSGGSETKKGDGKKKEEIAKGATKETAREPETSSTPKKVMQKVGDGKDEETKAENIKGRSFSGTTEKQIGSPLENGDRRVSETLLANSRIIFSRMMGDLVTEKENRHWLDADYGMSGHGGLADTNIGGVTAGYSPIMKDKYSLSMSITLDLSGTSLKENSGDGITGNLTTATLGIGVVGRVRPVNNLDTFALIYYGYNANKASSKIGGLDSGKDNQKYSSYDFGAALAVGYGFDITRVYRLKPVLQLGYLNSSIAKHDNMSERKLGSLTMRYALENIITVSRLLGFSMTLAYNQLLGTNGNSKDLYKEMDNLEFAFGVQRKFSNGDRLALNVGYKTSEGASGLGGVFKNGFKNFGELGLGVRYGF
jgi:hypothetical protein